MSEAAPTGGEALEQLARRLGIEPWFHDIWGQRHEVTVATRRALIKAFGWAGEDEAACRVSLSELERQSWGERLPPVRVITEGEPLDLPLTLPQPLPPGAAGGEVRWRLTGENGLAWQGQLALADLAPLEDDQGRYGGWQRRRLVLPLQPAVGYHWLEVWADVWTDGPGTNDAPLEVSIAVAPRRAFGLDELVPGGDGEPPRVWGLALQLYGVRSAGNWGIGDFGDLGRAGELAAGLGAKVVGLNPLHALFPADPGHISPYAPAHRGFLNILYIDINAVPGLADEAELCREIGAPPFQQALAAVRDAEMVDYPAVAALKLPVLERLYQHFRQHHLTGPADDPLAGEFRAFLAEQGTPLARHALFQALHEHFYRQDRTWWDWRNWPEPWQRPDSAEVTAFAVAHAQRVEFFQYLQWLADRQLAAAAARGRTAGLAVGLYRDLAVADHPSGSAAWAEPGIILEGARVGAPPDPIAPQGQNWGLAPFSPVGLRRTAYAPYIALLRANMRHAGLLRIDHVMALRHVFCFPVNGSGGAYLTFPFDDLLRLLVLESRRNRCVVVGEDLGTVPEGFRPALAEAGIMSYRVLYFERHWDQSFRPPGEFPAQALVTVSTHDLATLKGWWHGVDLDWRERLQHFPDPAQLAQQRQERMADRGRLLAALQAAGRLPLHWQPWEPVPDQLSPALVAAIHGYLAASPGGVMMVQAEDAIGELEQPNLPGTVDEHPNWRRRLSLSLAQLAHQPGLTQLVTALRSAGR